MKPISALKYTQLTMLSKPKSDRAIYRAIKKNRIRSILEVGLGEANRAVNLIRLAQTFSGSTNVRYTGVDMFDARPENQSTLQLIKVHQQLGALKAKTQLVPGQLDMAITRIANSHLRTDLIILSAGYTNEELENSWLYIPRMLHARSIVMLQPCDAPDAPYKTLNRIDVERIVQTQQKKTTVTQAAA